MPAHTHMRRSEIYVYFNLNDTRVFHLMGANAMAVPSPPAEPVTSASLPSKQKQSRIPRVLHSPARVKIVPMLARITGFDRTSSYRHRNVLLRRIECESRPKANPGEALCLNGHYESRRNKNPLGHTFPR